jgi:hypothetical protein
MSPDGLLDGHAVSRALVADGEGRAEHQIAP